MANIVFTQQLVAKIGKLGDVMASFLDEQMIEIQQELAAKFPNAPDDGLWKVLSVFVTLEGTKIPMTRSEIGEKTGADPAIVDFCLEALEQSRIIRLVDGIYEAAHDTLALQIANKRSAEEIGLLEVEKLIQNRYSAYQRTRSLLNKKELDYIEPFLPKLKLADDQRKFIKQSDRTVKRRRRNTTAIIILAFAVISSLAIWAVIQRAYAEEEKHNAQQERHRAELARTQAVKSANEAQTARKAAEDSATSARYQRQLALNEKVEANKQRDIAKRQEKIALQAKQLAEEQRQLAKDNETKAQQQEQLAKKNELQAQENELQAQENATKAQQQEQLAKDNETKALNLRKKGLAQALAIKSAQMTNPKKRKGLLAKEAYSIHLDAKGSSLDPDIYNGLYQATKSSSPEDFDQDFQTHTAGVRTILANTKGDQLFTAGSDGRMWKWQIQTWKTLGKPSYTNKMVRFDQTVDKSIAISPDNRWLASGGKKADIEIFDLQQDNFSKPTFIKVLHNRQDALAIAFAHDNKTLFTSGADRNIKQYDFLADSVSVVATLLNQASVLVIHPNQYLLLSGDVQGSLRLHQQEGKTWATTPLFSPRNGSVTAAKFHPNGDAFVVGYASGVMEWWVWNAPTNQYVIKHSLQKNYLPVTGFDVQQNRFSATCADGTTEVWEIEKLGLPLYLPLVLDDNKKSALSSRFVGNNQLAVGYLDGTVKFWTLDIHRIAEQLCFQLGNATLTETEKRSYIGEDVEYKSFQCSANK